VSVDVPAGISDGQRIRISGRGHAGERGGPAGDLYVQVRVKDDPRFVRDGNDLLTVVDVAAPLAALGTTIRRADARRARRGGGPGRDSARRDQGPAREGMPSLRRGRPGDVRVVINVVIPRRLSKHQRDLLEELSGTITPENLSSDEGMFSKLKRALGG